MNDDGGAGGGWGGGQAIIAGCIVKWSFSYLWIYLHYAVIPDWIQNASDMIVTQSVNNA